MPTKIPGIHTNNYHHHLKHINNYLFIGIATARRNIGHSINDIHWHWHCLRLGSRHRGRGTRRRTCSTFIGNPMHRAGSEADLAASLSPNHTTP